VVEAAVEVFPFLLCILRIRSKGQSEDSNNKNLFSNEESDKGKGIYISEVTDLNHVDKSDINYGSKAFQLEENSYCRAIFNLKTCRDSTRSLIVGNSLRIYNPIVIPPMIISADGPCGSESAQLLPLLICTQLCEAISDVL
jgi:hypothetical protein